MFVGSVPKEVVNQLLEVAPIRNGDTVFVCCSGSFRVDLALREKFERSEIYGNDVSLLSCALGALLTHRELPFKFTGQYAFMEDALDNLPYEYRVAALNVALEIGKYPDTNDFNRRHRQYYIDNFESLLYAAVERIQATYGARDIHGFTSVDFREHARAAAACDAVVVAFPPTYKGGYERQYKRLDENTDWIRPQYSIWEPEKIGEWIDELDAAGIRHCVFVDHDLDGREPLSKFTKPRARPVYLYGNRRGAKASLRSKAHAAEPFRFDPVNPAKLHAGSEVAVAPIESKHFNFLRNLYLAKGIDYSNAMWNYVVLIDGRVAGGFALSREQMGSRDALYLLSDFSVSRERKLSKLIAMLAASRQAVAPAERRMLVRIKELSTTVFTDRPVSMKYRGIWKLHARKPGFLQYTCEITDQSIGGIYADWYKRYA